MSWATSKEFARSARMSSVPMSSVVSPSMTVPPAATTASLTTPTTGLAARPLVASDPPQFVPKTRSASVISQRSTSAARATRARASSAPRSTARSEPPRSWMVMTSSGLSSAARIRSASS